MNIFLELEPGVKFEPTPEIPALQYFEGVDMNGMGMKAGLKPGDFLLEVCFVLFLIRTIFTFFGCNL